MRDDGRVVDLDKVDDRIVWRKLSAGATQSLLRAQTG
jgi:hypothetical protein